MIKFSTTLFFILIFIPKFLFSTNIVVINIEKLIDNNKNYKKIIIKINENQKDNSKKLSEKEIELEELFKKIEDSRIILSNEEINLLVENYNQELEKFNDIIENFNNHYQKEITNIRRIVLQEIIVLAEKYAKDNNIELILDSTSYLIASNAIDITNVIEQKLDNINLELEFEGFEKH